MKELIHVTPVETATNPELSRLNLPYNWDFIQNNIPPEKLAELRRRFMEEWGSGNYTKEEMIERYRMSERTFRDTIKLRTATLP